MVEMQVRHSSQVTPRVSGHFESIVANGGVFSCLFQGVRTPILQLSAMQEGDYTFQLTVTDSAGQQDTAQVTVFVQPGEQPPQQVSLLSPRRCRTLTCDFVQL